MQSTDRENAPVKRLSQTRNADAIKNETLRVMG